MEAVIESIVDKLRYLAKPPTAPQIDSRKVRSARRPSAPGLLSRVSDSDAEISDREFEILLDELADESIKNMGVNVPTLSDFAVSRAGIYEDRP